MFIVFEGISGTNKTYYANWLNNYLNDLHIDSILTKEPFNTFLFEDNLKFLNKDPITEFLLYAADRRDHLKHVIIPYISSSFVLISIHYSLFSVAYQGYGRGVPLDLINNIHDQILDGIYPDLTIYIDGIPFVNKAGYIESFYGMGFLNKVLYGYRKEINKIGGQNTLILNSNEDKEKNCDKIKDVVLSFLHF